MDFSDRLNLQKMINANNIEDLTETIQNKKHSALITKDFQKLILLKIILIFMLVLLVEKKKFIKIKNLVILMF